MLPPFVMLKPAIGTSQGEGVVHVSTLSNRAIKKNDAIFSTLEYTTCKHTCIDIVITAITLALRIVASNSFADTI